MTNRNWMTAGNAPRVMVPVDIYPKQVLGAPASRVYGAMVMRANNRTGLVDSTIKQIAEDAGMSESQAKVGLRLLLAHRWVTQVRHGHSRLSSKYQMHPAPQVDRPEIKPVNQPEIKPVQPDPEAGDADTPNQAVDQQVPRTDRPEIRRDHPVGVAGNPALTGRKSGHPLVYPYLSPTTTSSDADEGDTEERPDDTTDGVLLHLPQATPAKTTNGYTAAFEAFWQTYPRKDGKRPAAKAWNTHVVKTGADQNHVNAAAQRYAQLRRGQDPQYTKLAATWLNQECWTDASLQPQDRRVVNGPVFEGPR